TPFRRRAAIRGMPRVSRDRWVAGVEQFFLVGRQARPDLPQLPIVLTMRRSLQPAKSSNLKSGTHRYYFHSIAIRCINSSITVSHELDDKSLRMASTPSAKAS